ncbi:Hsp20/alpha crystallin family protein [Halolamina sp. CBA1230]|uniref:Hsp20/alpha crystallin family protein n=1 Tax=Halolamina sp. CBA1230 TaxID=1853690 RepID=UPI0009A1FE0E|nr:Hsp20/alpha crystallin family protein [Halolamina sp. CBA1230]QKY20016.1 Hsp20/alpha crystallin family protein [Halolamina sp. CBA1230]
MPLPENLTSSWTQGLDLPSKLFESGRNDYELFEEDGEFVLTVEMPGFDPESIAVTWEEGVLNVAAEHEDTQRGRRRTYHRRFRFPKTIDDESIEAEYNNGMLEIRLPIEADETVTGTEIEVKA